MWPDLKEQIAVEQAEIDELLAFHRGLLETCRAREPIGIELTAAGASLHALVNRLAPLPAPAFDAARRLESPAGISRSRRE